MAVGGKVTFEDGVPTQRVACPALCVAAEPTDSERVRSCSIQIPVEHALDVHVGGKLMRITCTPTHLIELIVGRLYTEGVIRSADDVDAVEISDDMARARVMLVDEAPAAGEDVEVVPTYGVSGRPVPPEERGVGLRPRDRRALEAWDVEQVFELARTFAEDTPIHLATNGAHSCYLAVDGEIRWCCEDLGRHNALDKVIGSALLAGEDLSRAVVFSSGRIPADMAAKAIRAGIPMLVTKAVPTDLAVRMAREAGLVLICSARPDSVKVFNDPTGTFSSAEAAMRDAVAAPCAEAEKCGGAAGVAPCVGGARL